MTAKNNGNGNGSNGFDGLVAIQLSTFGWPGRVSLTPEDLGIDPKEMDEEIMNLGNKKLYSQDWRSRFNSIRTLAFKYLEANSYPYVLDWIRSVPQRKAPKVINRLEEIEKQYVETAQEFRAKFDEIKDEWRSKIIKKYGEEKGQKIWERMLPHYPSEAYLKSRFRFSINVFNIKGAEPPAKTTSKEIIEAYERAKADLDAKCKEAVELAFLDYMKRIKEVVAKLANNLKEDKIIRNDSLEKVRQLHDWARDMNIFGYKPLEEEVAKLKAGLDGVDIKALKDNEPLKKQLTELADGVAAAASKIEDVSKVSGNYRRMIDLS